MKDLYSFDRDDGGLDESYWRMYDAYARIFQRCGLSFRPVEADPGAIGGNMTHEFMALAEAGEAEIVYCSHCDYAANVEKAQCVTLPGHKSGVLAPLTAVPTPGVRTVEELERFFQRPADQMIKTLIYHGKGVTVAALIRGDHEVNEIKLARALGLMELELATETVIENVSGAPRGFAGPVGLRDCKIIADPAVMEIENGISGGNSADVHFIGINPGRDFSPHLVQDIRLARAGDPCPCGGGTLQGARGIEVGQVFKLGTKYSRDLGATFLDESGQEHPVLMGCYGIGVTRTVAAAVEQHNDEHGICWPMSIAPYQVVVVPVNYGDGRQQAVADQLYHELRAAGVEVLVDDRDERPGVKFKDADLMGFPIRITIGPRALVADQVEVKRRDAGEAALVPINEVVTNVRNQIRKELV